MKVNITVFTPIYNRAYCVEKLYNSLKRQTFKEFEWLIIDDGSTDNIGELAESWMQKEKSFPIRFYRSKNGGKMRAVNKAVQLAQAPAFFIVDSDDYLLDDALENVWRWFLEVAENRNFAGVSGLRKIKTIDAEYDFDYVDATNLERRKYNLIIDMAECYKTEIIKGYPSPEFENENYMAPSYVWNSIAKDGYKIRWYNKVIYMGEYQPDGLSAASFNVRIRNPIGWGKLIQLNIECKNDPEFTEFQYYLYHENLKDILTKEEIAEYLGLDCKDFEKYISQKPSIIDKINIYLNEKGIRKIALYGLGGEAKRFLNIAKDLKIEILYGIDKKPNKLLPVCYSPDDVLPEADAIFITNRAGIDGIKRKLREVTDIEPVSIQTDILEKSLNYYFFDI